MNEDEKLSIAGLRKLNNNLKVLGFKLKGGDGCFYFLYDDGGCEVFRFELSQPEVIKQAQKRSLMAPRRFYAALEFILEAITTL